MTMKLFLVLLIALPLPLHSIGIVRLWGLSLDVGVEVFDMLELVIQDCSAAPASHEDFVQCAEMGLEILDAYNITDEDYDSLYAAVEDSEIGQGQAYFDQKAARQDAREAIRDEKRAQHELKVAEREQKVQQKLLEREQAAIRAKQEKEEKRERRKQMGQTRGNGNIRITGGYY